MSTHGTGVETVEAPIAKTFMDRVEDWFSYHLANQDQLYRPVIALSLLISVFGLVSLLRVLAVYNYSGWISSETDFLILFPVLSIPLAIAVGIAARKGLIAKRRRGVTLFALFLGLQVLHGQFLLSCFGLYALFNADFQRAFKDATPEWYSKMLTKF